MPVKISALTTASSSSGTDVIPLVQSGTTKKISLSNLGGLESANVIFTPTGSGAVATSVNGWLNQWVSVFNFIPTAEWAAIRAGTSTTDVTSYIQAAHDSITVRGTVDFPSGKYKCNGGLTLNASKVRFDLREAELDFSGLSSAGTGITVTGNGSGTAYANAPGGIVGGILTGPGDLTSAIALYFHTAAEAGPSYTAYQSTYINGWDTGIKLGDNAYLLTFIACNIRVGGKCFHHPAGTTNSGENIQFLGGTLSGATYGIYTVNGDGDVHLGEVSVDTSTGLYVRGSEVSMSGGHTEVTSVSVDAASSGGTNARITMSGVRQIQNASSGATPFISGGDATFLTLIGGSINPHASTTTSISMNANSRLTMLGTVENYSGPVNAFNNCARIYWPGGVATINAQQAVTPQAATWQFAQWNPSDVAGTETAPTDVPTAQKTATTYMTMASSSGVLTFTFTAAGRYVIAFSSNMSGAASATAQYIRLALGGTADRLFTPTGTIYEVGNAGSAATFSLEKTFVVEADANETVTLAPAVAITSGGVVGDFDMNAAATAFYEGEAGL